MTDEVANFCMNHCCREGLEHRSDFCPIMKEHKDEMIHIPYDCEMIYYRKRNEGYRWQE